MGRWLGPAVGRPGFWCASSPGIPGESAQDNLFTGARLPGIGQAHHAERDQQPDQTGEDRNKKRHLKGDMPGLGVDPDDLLLCLRWLAGELLLELGVAHHFGVMLQDLGDLLLLSPRKHGARLGHASEAHGQRRQQDGAGERQPERQAERPSRRVHPGRLADAFLRDRGQRVVVELGD